MIKKVLNLIEVLVNIYKLMIREMFSMGKNRKFAMLKINYAILILKKGKKYCIMSL